jgi:hypothetical protein
MKCASRVRLQHCIVSVYADNGLYQYVVARRVVRTISTQLTLRFYYRAMLNIAAHTRTQHNTVASRYIYRGLHF